MQKQYVGKIFSNVNQIHMELIGGGWRARRFSLCTTQQEYISGRVGLVLARVKVLVYGI